MNIIITGASRGIGLATACYLASDPANQVICISRSALPENKLSRNIHSIQFDIASGNTEDLIPKIKLLMGSVDILINNAGTLINKKFETISHKEWDEIFSSNFFGPARLIRALLPLMGAGSHIVNIASMGAVQGSVKFPGLSAYSSSKAALANLTEALAVELSDRNIFVNCLCPGSAQTEMFSAAFPDVKAGTSPEEMAEFIGWFSLNGQKQMNGKILALSRTTP